MKMTFKDVIAQLYSKIEIAKEKLLEAQDPNGEFADKPYFYAMGQILSQRSLTKAEDDLEFLVKHLDEYHIDPQLETDGLEILILGLERQTP
jgi:hypothetical protein